MTQVFLSIPVNVPSSTFSMYPSRLVHNDPLRLEDGPLPLVGEGDA
jgi:hypothetical protein